MVKKVITKLDSSKACSPDCIPVVILKNCEPDCSNILAELFNMSKRVLFSRLLESLISGPCILILLGKGLQLKTLALLVFFLWLIKSFKNL